MKENTVSLKVAQISQIGKEAAPLFNFSSPGFVFYYFERIWVLLQKISEGIKVWEERFNNTRDMAKTKRVLYGGGEKG